MAWSTPSTQITGDLITAAIWNQNVVYNTIALTPSGISIFIDGGGTEILTGLKMYVEIPFKCDIDRNTVLPDQSGSIVFDIWKDTYANYPPVVGDSICASAKPTVSSGTKSQDSTLTGWTTAIAAGDILAFNVDSVTTITFCTLALKFTRS
jgi:hypothetical protein